MKQKLKSLQNKYSEMSLPIKAGMNLYVKDDNKEKVLSAICGLTIVLTTAGFLIYLIFNRQIANAMQMSGIMTFCLFVSIIFQAGIN